MRPLKRQMKNWNNIIPQGKIKKQEDKQEKTSMHDLPTLFVKRIDEALDSDEKYNGYE